ncbi:MAG TPA: hypothetical protein VIL27_04065 [Clostridia bacterium]
MADKSKITTEKRKPKASEKNKAPAKTIASIVVQPELIKKPKKEK